MSKLPNLVVADEFYFDRPFMKKKIKLWTPLLFVAALTLPLFRNVVDVPLLIAGGITILLFIFMLQIVKLFKDNILPPTTNQYIRERYEREGESAFEVNASITLTDHIMLKGSFFNGQTSSIENKDKKIIVAFSGNLGFVDRATVESYQADLPGYDIVNFNYRGSLNSEGKFPTYKKLVNDGIEIVDSLIAQGYSPQNITLLGCSLGGIISIGVKEHFDKILPDNQALPLIVYHSFSDIITMGKHSTDTFIVCDKNSTYFECFTSYIKPVLKILVAPIVYLLGWDFTITADRWEKLKGRKSAFGGGKKDIIASPSVSLASYLKDNGVSNNVYIEEKEHACFDVQSIIKNFLNK
ncbi:MAG: hypothetical protein S4CHLAM20_01640 [Chlamydiia bacterium]|nr:hypothetical protein [Chlamydiia bacterium]